MASPATSGIIALMLQANPNLNPTEVRNILAQTAILDTFTGPLTSAGDINWGHGKINAYQAVIAAAALNTGVTTIPGATLNCSLYPNPNKGTFTINYNSNADDNMNIEVFDLNGHQVFNEVWSVSAGMNTKNLNISKLASGIYISRLSSTQGSALIKTTVVQ